MTYIYVYNSQISYLDHTITMGEYYGMPYTKTGKNNSAAW